MLQFLNTEGNCPRTEAFMVFENRNPFFGEDYPRCLSGVENVGNCVYRENGAAVEGLADRNGHRRKVVGKGKIVRWSCVELHGPKVRVASVNSPKICSSTVIC